MFIIRLAMRFDDHGPETSAEYYAAAWRYLQTAVAAANPAGSSQA